MITKRVFTLRVSHFCEKCIDENKDCGLLLHLLIVIKFWSNIIEK